MNNQKKLIIMVITLSLILILSSSYALLRSTKTSQNNYSISIGDLEVNFQDTKTNALKATNMYPMTDEEGREVEQELVFTVKNTGTVKAYYNVWIEETSKNPEFKTVIKYIVKKDANDYNFPNILSKNKYVDYNATLESQEEATYHVKVYLDESADNTYMGKTFNAKIHVDSSQEFYTVSDRIKEQITSHTTESCNPIIEDEDGTIYFSGSNDCVNFNYVWYSGKLWRITAINKDDTIKMITQDVITVIQWGTNTTYKDSWIYQWLNEDFLDTLYNQENIIVQNAKWNATESSSYTTKPAETTIVEGNVGLLNAYEYYQSYQKLGTEFPIYASGYLNIGYYWWLTLPYNSSTVLVVSDLADIRAHSPSLYAFGVRPSINLKSDIKISGGEGTKEKPYRIDGDKTVAEVDDKLNSRVSGEYVNFDGKKYRIVGIENETTKLNSVDYVRNDNGVIMVKKFGSNNNWPTSVASNDANYWGYYLNNAWYNSINEPYKSMLVEGTYYLGEYPDNVSYKNTICSESNTIEKTKTCSKTSSTWTGRVGLPRNGEMFSAMLGNGYTDTTGWIWLITPYSSSDIRYVSSRGFFDADKSPLSITSVAGARPSINLKSDILISGGTGTLESPYEIKIAS